MIRSFLLLVFLVACAAVPPPDGASLYPGKPTLAILGPQAEPQPDILDALFLLNTSWPGNVQPFDTYAICPLTTFTKSTVGCLHWYYGRKIDWTLTLEYWHAYHGQPDWYVYEFKGWRPEDDHSEQFAIGWHKLDAVCAKSNMARC